MPSDSTQTDLPSLAALREQDARQLRTLLIGMAEGGAEMAALYVQQAKEQAYAATPGAGPSRDCASAYSDVSRSVRQSVMLIQKLTAPEPKAAPVHDRVAVRTQIIRKVEDAIHREAPADQAERLHAELLERLEGPALDEDIKRRPQAEIIDEMTRDLGVAGAIEAHLWKRRTPADLALLAARAAAPVRGRAAQPPAPREGAEARDPGVPPIRGP